MVSSPVPVLGPFVPFARNPVRFIRQCYDKYGGVYTVGAPPPTRLSHALLLCLALP